MSAVDRALARSLLDRAGAGAVLVRHDRHPWASLTFEGQRHRLEMELATPAAAAFAAGLEELEVPLPGHILADLAVDARSDGDGARTRFILAALTLADR